MIKNYDNKHCILISYPSQQRAGNSRVPLKSRLLKKNMYDGMVITVNVNKRASAVWY